MQLLATGNEELIEGNKHGDHFWGVCNGHGENMLGKLLMQLRAELQVEKQPLTIEKFAKMLSDSNVVVNGVDPQKWIASKEGLEAIKKLE